MNKHEAAAKVVRFEKAVIEATHKLAVPANKHFCDKLRQELIDLLTGPQELSKILGPTENIGSC